MYALSDESNMIRSGEAIGQKIKDVVEAREKVLKKLRSELISNRNPKNVNLTAAVEKLSSIRMCSLTIVEYLSTLARKFQSTTSPYFI
jgi:hypothetical protein